jgi:aspartyl-tRNA(Asn)/glutamyl-tRNA(Gln) amidotransferase subunit A
MTRQTSLQELARRLEAGETSSRRLVEDALARIADPAGEGARCFITVDADGALAEAWRQDGLRRTGQHASPWAGIPFSVKDLFDLAGQVTTAGSILLRGEAPALADAPAIAALKARGLVVLGRTNMTEFAYSGVGLNSHYGTPLSSHDRATGRIPGGSTSGGAVAVADGMGALTIGTDTGGSCRIPAAYNGLVGFKPTAHRVNRAGAYPLSRSLDSIGPIAADVSGCAIADAIMAGDWDGAVAERPARGLRLAMLTTTVLQDMDDAVAADFEIAVERLREAGAAVVPVEFAAAALHPRLAFGGSIGAYEAFAHHQRLLTLHERQYDPRVATRLWLAKAITASDHASHLEGRAGMMAAFNQLMAGFDAMILPTTPIVPPPLAALASDEGYARANSLSLRNTSLGNFLDACAISLPMQAAGCAPTGFMLMAPGGSDLSLFAVAQAVERIVSRRDEALT